MDLNGQTVVRCELLSDAEEQAPYYIGLSYTWGDPHIRRPILVGDKIFWATENLAIALEYLQEDDKTIIFWIDAVCIDQTNLNEKSIQVQRMGHVFSSAALVIAWIGPAPDESDLAIQEIESYTIGIESHSGWGDYLREKYTALPHESINALFGRPWFKRVWVGQEVALNEQVIFICGQHEIDREDLFACQLVFYRSKVLFEGVKWSGSYERFKVTKPLPLRDFLSDGYHLEFGSELESSDPRDFIYSCFGQISDTLECELRADYTKSVEEVYTDFAEALIRAGMTKWLGYMWRLSRTYENLPSWVPDWSSTRLCRNPGPETTLEGSAVEVCYIATGSKALKMSARRIAQISHIKHSPHSLQGWFGVDPPTSALEAQEEEDKIMLSLDRIRQILDEQERWSPEEIDKAVFNLSTGFSTVRAGFTWNTQSEPAYDWLGSYKAFRGLVSSPDPMVSPQTWRENASRDYLNMLRDSNITDLFVTSTDIVGTSRDEVQPGDWVCVLGNVRGVRILREVDGGFYRIVSDGNVSPHEDVENSDAPVEIITII